MPAHEVSTCCEMLGSRSHLLISQALWLHFETPSFCRTAPSNFRSVPKALVYTTHLMYKPVRYEIARSHGILLIAKSIFLWEVKKKDNHQFLKNLWTLSIPYFYPWVLNSIQSYPKTGGMLIFSRMIGWWLVVLHSKPWGKSALPYLPTLPFKWRHVFFLTSKVVLTQMVTDYCRLLGTG